MKKKKKKNQPQQKQRTTWNEMRNERVKRTEEALNTHSFYSREITWYDSNEMYMIL